MKVESGNMEKKEKEMVRKFWPLILAALVVLALVIQSARLSSAKAAQAEMEATIERQNAVIDGLNHKVKEDEAFIKDNIPVITSEMLKEKLNTVCDLVTEQYIYRNADKLEQNQSWLFGWDRPFSSKSILVTYDGVIKAGVDLSKVTPEVDEENRTITITLPASRITDNNIPQETITVVEVKNGLFNKVTIEDYNQFISEQKIVMQEKAIDRGILTEADKNAQEAVRSLLSAIPGISTDPREGSYTLIVK